jgi:hypothetical protein
MSKLLNRILSQQGGAQQASLLKKNGPTSDGFQDKDDDDSSSLSGKRDGSSSTNKKKFVVARRFFRRKTAVGRDGDDEGYGKLDPFVCAVCVLCCSSKRRVYYRSKMQNPMRRECRVEVHGVRPHLFCVIKLGLSGEHC